MSSLYGSVVADHFRNPRNRGELPSADAAHEGVNPLCGDRIRIELRIDEGHIAAARFRGDACMVAVAAASLLTGIVEGMEVAQAEALDDARLLAALETPLRPSRIGCAMLPLQVLRGALAQVRR
jgi:nitrogen fixation protein NifU and related proteins